MPELLIHTKHNKQGAPKRRPEGVVGGSDDLNSRQAGTVEETVVLTPEEEAMAKVVIAILVNKIIKG